MPAMPMMAPQRSGGRLGSPVRNSPNLPIKSILRESYRASTKAAAGLVISEKRTHLKRKVGDRYEDSDLTQSDDDIKKEDDADNNKIPFSLSPKIKTETDTDSKDAISPNGGHLAKRQKTVHFDMSLNVTAVVPDIGGRSLEDTKQSVREALEKHAAGERHCLDELEELFSREHEPHHEADDYLDEDEKVQPEDLVLYVVALTSCTPLISKKCFELVKHILASSWMGRDEKFFRAYVQFMATLASSQGGYLRPILDMIIEKFKEPRTASWTVKDFPHVNRETAQRRLHFALRYMLELFPAAKTIVCKLVAHKFPFPNESKSVFMFYLDNILRLREYAPAINPDLVEIIISEVVKLDTEFQLDLTDMDDELVAKVMHQLTGQDDVEGVIGADIDDDNDRLSDDEDDVEEDSKDAEHIDQIADNDDDDTVNNDASDLGDDDSVFGVGGYGETSRLDKSTNLVHKLDASLDRLFAVFAPSFEDPDSEAARTCMEDMLSDFANFVLTVPSSRHTQFLIFHFSQKSPKLQDLFTGTLLNLGFESNRPVAVRQAAAAYLSSYVARAARVPRETVRNVASILCHRIDVFRRTNTAACRGPDLRRYQELYSWVQALLYIFCFRWRDLVDGYPRGGLVDPDEPATFIGQDLEWMPGLKQALTNIIYAPFNPLRVCSPPIVAEFAKLAHALRLMYVFPRIESNKSIHLSQYASGRYGAGDALREDAGYTVDDEKWLQLEGNFPFDPYHLPVSKRWLEGDYVSWTPIPGVSGGAYDDDDEDDDEEDEEDDEEFEEDTATDPEEEGGL